MFTNSFGAVKCVLWNLWYTAKWQIRLSPLLNAMMVQIQTKCSRFLFIYIKSKRISLGSSKIDKTKEKEKIKTNNNNKTEIRTRNLSHRQPFAIAIVFCTQHTVKYTSTRRIRMMTTMMVMMMKAHTQVYVHINMCIAAQPCAQGMGLYGHTIPCYIHRKWTWEIKIQARPRPNQTFSPDAKVYFVSLCSILLFRVVLLRWLSFWVCSTRTFYHSQPFNARSSSAMLFPRFTPFLARSLHFSISLIHFRFASFSVYFGVCAWAQDERTHRSLLLCIILYTWIVYRLPTQSTLIMVELTVQTTCNQNNSSFHV